MRREISSPTRSRDDFGVLSAMKEIKRMGVTELARRLARGSLWSPWQEMMPLGSGVAR